MYSGPSSNNIALPSAVISSSLPFILLYLPFFYCLLCGNFTVLPLRPTYTLNKGGSYSEIS